ncbi:hypothetical protein FM106_17925 [Brachybacterium faecium]|nr:hypothetical protein FM106_17925 [Brachybacterium faecium]
MSVDPNIDYHSHDPEDGEQPAEDPRIREAEEIEARMRRALATKDDPLRDGESTSERLRRLEQADAEKAAGSSQPEADEGSSSGERGEDSPAS